jgi:hypothetical protein
MLFKMALRVTLYVVKTLGYISEMCIDDGDLWDHSSKNLNVATELNIRIKNKVLIQDGAQKTGPPSRRPTWA